MYPKVSVSDFCGNLRFIILVLHHFPLLERQNLPHSEREVGMFARNCVSPLSLSIEGGKCTRYKVENRIKKNAKISQGQFMKLVTLRQVTRKKHFSRI